MKRFQILLLASLLSVLSACGGGSGMSASEYLTENVAFWNGTASTVQQWTIGNRGEELQKALASGKGIASLKSGLEGAHTEIQQYLTRIDQMPPNEDAKDVHQKLRTYVQSSEEMFGILLEMAALPEGYSKEQMMPLAEKLQAVGNRIDTEMQALDAAQDAYAKKHGIQLQRH
ncbi:hypothetical protein KQ945_09990 [Bacillus subtilis subsp. subtilis]|nr:hypothetical protein [Bacillus subtilis subsp. subtilis]